MEHPLATLSLTPLGFVFPRYHKRLEIESVLMGSINPEHIIAQCWEKYHHPRREEVLPVETIVHTILPGLKRANVLTKGDFIFRGLPYLSRDILVLSTMVQWFATNVGNSVIEEKPFRPWMGYLSPEREFLFKYKTFEENRALSAPTCIKPFMHVLTHVCTEQCRGDEHRYLDRDVTPRDHALADGLLRWLGKKDGREFLDSFRKKRTRAYKRAHPTMRLVA